MKLNRLLAGALAIVLATPAVAGPAVPLGTPLGSALGILLGGPTLGGVLGLTVGANLPLAGSGLLVVAAVSLVAAIRIARRKRAPRA